MAIVLSDALTLLILGFFTAIQTAIITKLANAFVEHMKKRAEEAKKKLEEKIRRQQPRNEA